MLLELKKYLKELCLAQINFEIEETLVSAEKHTSP